MKKVFVTIPCLLLGGSEVAALQMVQALIAGGYAVYVVVYYEQDERMAECYRNAGAELIFLDEKREGLKGLLRLTGKLRTLFRKERPDVVHVQYFAPGMIPILAARLAGVRNVFATVHAAGNNGYNWKSKLMFRISALMTSHFFCVAENTERFWFGNIGKGKHSTLHNGVDVEAFQNTERIELPLLVDAHPIIGIVGRVVKLKGHDCLFRAVKRLLPEFPKLKVCVVGEGANRNEMISYSEKLGIAEYVLWLGRVEPEKLPGYYKTFDVLAMPSHWEGFGLTAAEAMAAGVPVVASDVPGLREVVGEAGLLFPVNDDFALAQSLKMSLTQRGQFASAGQKRIQDHFALTRQQKKWREAYQQLLK